MKAPGSHDRRHEENISFHDLFMLIPASMKLLRKLANNQNAASLANRFRRKRFELFRSFVAPLPKPLRILDLGGTEDFWKQMGCSEADGLRITLLNLHQEPATLPFVTSISGDARSLKEFADHAFDIVFSNSVIEHVGGLEEQRRMAAEIARCGRRYFVQTPARSFPIEPHFLFPFFAVLPQRVRLFLVRNFNLGWYQKIPDRRQAEEFLRGFQLLSRAELVKLFPSATLYTERVAGLPKSYTVVYGFS